MASMVKNLMMFGKGYTPYTTRNDTLSDIYDQAQVASLNVEERMVNDDKLELFVQVIMERVVCGIDLRDTLTISDMAKIESPNFQLWSGAPNKRDYTHFFKDKIKIGKMLKVMIDRIVRKYEAENAKLHSLRIYGLQFYCLDFGENETVK
ncbi:hypothetical protein GLOIN_2v1487330 [Rhizophagus irregularis DAOM 181602=DAOM 197198]|uniref:Uncharacterized protein n=1 Tax=Rhizophagus irregularis (strain DAOM 181602 / DAOM 197198 / MUCL 43194) TaxID=747089 RepID=A0A2P4P3U0_RHIID|nr:hypothetical protein GLOIN_2v1487330 [Rhizophagus irregularis DAOM 181602=DAOM 197198]POG60048.1 hypothetical protein GLOIN_2v1487330 [Rhizophagus irregularis DAOM 181602=DAOM 197198]|eukprot:XP_025166914.1 hypothetical protein GLOIN_2v1487330 [Rhizophagus irregularis DAOM 181602=DAOM 197198]